MVISAALCRVLGGNMGVGPFEDHVHFGNAGFKAIAASTPQFWSDALSISAGEQNGLAFCAPFGSSFSSLDEETREVLAHRIGAERFENAMNCLLNCGLEGETFGVYGAGTFGLTVALILSEAGATGTVYSSPTKTTAMRGALGILEPQGTTVEPYWLGSIPFLRKLIDLGAPLRNDQIRYYYQDRPNIDFVAELSRTPDTHLRIEETSEYGCKTVLSFNGIILAAPALSVFYTAALQARGVEFTPREINVIEPAGGASITVAAMGLGRGQGFSDVDIPGNAGQIIHLSGPRVSELIHENPAFQKCGSFGRPRPEGSVNIVLPSRTDPYLLIGATKHPGDATRLVQKIDYEFLLDGVKVLWPELYHAMLHELKTGYLEEHSYRCIRPGSGSTPFTVKETNGCVDIFAAGGTGNSIAPAAALHALALALEIVERNR
jgi:FAD dependent oxidoreductase